MTTTAALVALAGALLAAPGPVGAGHRLRAVTTPSAATSTPAMSSSRAPVLAALAVALCGGALAGVGGAVAGTVVGVIGAVVLVRWGPGLGAGARPAPPDPLGEAGAWDQLAACLRAGLPLARAARAVAGMLPPAAGAALGRVADLAALGADPVSAWEPALAEPSTGRLARAARRSARSGSAVADVATAVAADVRGEAADAVTARAERAGVLVTGPLGLCFLPAFLALGIVPVVVGLAGPLLEQR